MSAPLSLQDVRAAWWPLAVSWLMMAVEQPAIAAVVARLPDPEVGLGAYGGVVFPIALVVEAPVIMLLAASTELSRDSRRVPISVEVRGTRPARSSPCSTPSSR